jgi:hypothetical protein
MFAEEMEALTWIRVLVVYDYLTRVCTVFSTTIYSMHACTNHMIWYISRIHTYCTVVCLYIYIYIYTVYQISIASTLNWWERELAPLTIDRLTDTDAQHALACGSRPVPKCSVRHSDWSSHIDVLQEEKLNFSYVFSPTSMYGCSCSHSILRAPPITITYHLQHLSASLSPTVTTCSLESCHSLILTDEKNGPVR